MKKEKIRDREGRLFTYLAFVSSDCLDQYVNQERTNFNLIHNHEGFTEDIGLIAYKEIQNELISVISNNLSPFLQGLQEEKQKEIQKYIIEEAVEYRPLLKYATDKLESIKPGLPPEKLEIELHKIMSSYELSLKETGVKILRTPLEHFERFPEYSKEYYDFLEQYNDLGMSKLARYVIHRKIIISLFEKKPNC
ncbi:hypothetical protein OA07_02530 [Aphanizomenon flos-aquae 2012/KM1/D3]|uniref:hypothetical protein n=1 Tax=Aphanizomenon flos-aquae TaxID=1176 RepID=UPI00054283F0|nr:hypothetical protein [Aphanizomenon flos-aquae]KHG42867.1 hypothetical protein OA07_02530 [Aphanizomenon flos-aquae 2012/KM1/D3]